MEMSAISIAVKRVAMAVLVFTVGCLCAAAANFPADSLLTMRTDFRIGGKNTCTLELPDSAGVGMIKVRGVAEPDGSRPRGESSAWGFRWYGEGDSLLLTVKVNWDAEFPDDTFDEQRYLHITATDCTGNTLFTNNVYDGLEISGKNCMLQLCAYPDRVEIETGQYRPVGAGRVPVCVMGAKRVEMFSTHGAKVRGVAAYSRPDASLAVNTGWSPESVAAALQQPALQSMEGEYYFLDRDTNDKKAIPGGQYRVAIVRHDVSHPVAHRPAALQGSEAMPTYDVVYLGGATTNAAAWTPGMLKAHLYATPFEGRYIMVWYASMFEPLIQEVFAEQVTPDLVSFNFPLYNARIRLAKKKF